MWQRGVTLIELLVVMAILAFVTAMAVYNAPPARSGAKEEADRFAARAQAAYEDAVLGGAVTSIEVMPSGYRILRFANGEWKNDSNSRRFGERTLSRDVKLDVTLGDAALANKSAIDGEDDKDAPQRIIIDPIGVTTPYTIVFSDDRQRWRVSNDTSGLIKVENDAQR